MVFKLKDLSNQKNLNNSGLLFISIQSAYDIKTYIKIFFKKTLNIIKTQLYKGKETEQEVENNQKFNYQTMPFYQLEKEIKLIYKRRQRKITGNVNSENKIIKNISSLDQFQNSKKEEKRIENKVRTKYILYSPSFFQFIKTQ